MKISIATSVYNQEKNISDFIDAALEIADEIIIIDHFSTDLTKKICMSYKKVHFVEKELELAHIVKQWAISLCTGDFNIFLDFRDFSYDLASKEILSLCSVSHSLKMIDLKSQT